MVHLAECIGIAARYYNLALVFVAVMLYIYLLRMEHKKVFIKPWKYIFVSICIYIVEQTLSALEGAGLLKVSVMVYPLLEFFIIIYFIYALLVMREHIKDSIKVRKK